jgi:hypothetical protein
MANKYLNKKIPRITPAATAIIKISEKIMYTISPQSISIEPGS